jgi:hypothetical protein
MKKIAVTLFAALCLAIAQGETTTPTSPAGVVSNFIREVSALASNHTELAEFPGYIKRLEAQSRVDFKKGITPFAVSFDRNTTPVLTKRRIRPSDCGTNGIFLQFILDDGTNEAQAPIDTVTYFPMLRLTLYADVVLWENGSPALKMKLESIVARHKAMLSELDKKAVKQESESTGRDPGNPGESLAAHLKWLAEHPDAVKRVEALHKWKEEHPEVMKEIKAFNLRYPVLMKTQEGRTEALAWFKSNRRLWEGTPLEAEMVQEIKRLEPKASGDR